MTITLEVFPIYTGSWGGT